MYKCSKCGIEVAIDKDTGEVIKPCDCKEPIIAEAFASVQGMATFK